MGRHIGNMTGGRLDPLSGGASLGGLPGRISGDLARRCLGPLGFLQGSARLGSPMGLVLVGFLR